MNETASTETGTGEPGGAAGVVYQVFARKYRPSTFADLVGQDAMVQTLTNAIQSDRLAQAYILTGVRGIGKTSTARIIARALNCIGPDGQGGPTPEPCGVCENCVAIAEDRHVDVLEMDAASRTGVDDIREVIEGVRYRPTAARFKIYIIDEVHMLSRHAFNALLKTLEEPPEHVKFVFATTEIRKVPVTVLSRCQRFDLKRVDMEALKAHFAGIAEAEGAKIADGALHLIARAADGSVRDGLSLLDQAVSHADPDGGEIGEDDVRAMLGLADRSRSFQLLESVMGGDVAEALELLDQLYREGADPLAILEDLLEITHWLTRIKVVPAAAVAPEVPEIERVRGRDMESRLTMAALARSWQMLLKGLQEVRMAPSQIQAAEMILVRLAHTAVMPTPEEAIRQLQDAPTASAAPQTVPAAPAVPSPGAASSAVSASDPSAAPAPSSPVPQARMMTGTGDVVAMVEPVSAEAPMPESQPEPEPVPVRNDEVSAPPVPQASNDPGSPVESPGVVPADAKAREEAAKHPLVRAVMDTFPGATIEEVREGMAAPAVEAPENLPDETDGPGSDQEPV